MCCTSLIAQETTMATTQLTRAACYEITWPTQEKQETHDRPLRMSWVVVTDANGKRQLRMQWTVAEEHAG
jgi:hypothetical protein